MHEGGGGKKTKKHKVYGRTVNLREEERSTEHGVVGGIQRNKPSGVKGVEHQDQRWFTALQNLGGGGLGCAIKWDEYERMEEQRNHHLLGPQGGEGDRDLM